MESLADFVERLCSDVGCFYHRTHSGIYSLKKYNTNQRGRMGVFGWVAELKRTNRFRIESYKDLADRVGVTHLADEEHNLGIFGPGVDGIFFYVERGSHGEDYKKAVTALKDIMNLKN
jgi:hypothetical protein